MLVAYGFRTERRSRLGIEHNPAQSLSVWRPDRQAWIIRQHGIDSNQDRICSPTQLHSTRPSQLAGNPFRLPRGSCDFAVQRHGRLDRHQRRPLHDPMIKCLIQPLAFLREETRRDGNSRAFHYFEGLTTVARIRISGAHHDSPDSGGYYRVGARRGPPVCGTGFKRHVKCSASWIKPSFLRIEKRFDFSMRLACAMMPAMTDNLAPLDQDRANHRIWRSRPVTAPRQPESLLEECRIPSTLVHRR